MCGKKAAYRARIIYHLFSIFPPRIKLLNKKEFWRIYWSSRELYLYAFHPTLYLLHRILYIRGLARFTWRLFYIIKTIFEKVYGKCWTLIAKLR